MAHLSPSSCSPAEWVRLLAAERKLRVSIQSINEFAAEVMTTAALGRAAVPLCRALKLSAQSIFHGSSTIRRTD